MLCQGSMARTSRYARMGVLIGDGLGLLEKELELDCILNRVILSKRSGVGQTRAYC